MQWDNVKDVRLFTSHPVRDKRANLNLPQGDEQMTMENENQSDQEPVDAERVVEEIKRMKRSVEKQKADLDKILQDLENEGT
jgi:hypothetical protein